MYESEYITILEIANLFNCSFTNVISICMMEGEMVSINQKLYFTDDEDLTLLNTIDRELVKLGFSIKL